MCRKVLEYALSVVIKSATTFVQAQFDIGGSLCTLDPSSVNRGRAIATPMLSGTCQL